MAIQNIILTTLPSAVFTSVGDTAITCAYFCNTSNSPVTISVYAVASGDSAVAGNRIYDSVLLTAKDTYVIDMEKLILSDGDKLMAEATQNNAITVTISSVSI